jgi:hypothetical protein
MGHYRLASRRLEEGDRFGDQHFIILLYHSRMKCGSYLSTLLCFVLSKKERATRNSYSFCEECEKEVLKGMKKDGK